MSIVEAAILWDSRFFRKKSFIITFVQPMRKILMGFFILNSSLDIVANI